VEGDIKTLANDVSKLVVIEGREVPLRSEETIVVVLASSQI